MLYNYGEYDLLYSPSRLGENLGKMDFDPDFRTGKPVIGSFEAMRRVFNCYASGIFVTSAARWKNPPYISAEVVDLIEVETHQLKLPSESKVLAFVWEQRTTTADIGQCKQLPRFRVPE